MNLEDKLIEICSKSVEITRKAVGLNKIVSASIGPTGKFIINGGCGERRII